MLKLTCAARAMGFRNLARIILELELRGWGSLSLWLCRRIILQSRITGVSNSATQKPAHRRRMPKARHQKSANHHLRHESFRHRGQV